MIIDNDVLKTLKHYNEFIKSKEDIMKNMKKLFALLIVLVMTVSMLNACGKSEGSKEETNNITGAATATGSATATKPAQQEDMAEINIMAMSLGPMGEGKTAVEDAINAITEKEINTHVTLTFVEVGSYTQQLGLAITGNEKVDLCLLTPIPGSSFSSLLAQNQLVALNDLLPQYASETVKEVGNLIKGTTVNGSIYAIPTYRDMASNAYIIARKDQLESAGQLDAFNNMKTWSEFEKVMKAVTAKNDISGISNGDAQGTIVTLGGLDAGADNFAENFTFDTLGDQYKIIASDKNGKVYDCFESASYKNAIDRAHKWYEDGLVYKDAATSKDTGDTLMKSNVTFSYVNMGETNVVANKTGATGHDVVVNKIASYILNTAATTKFCWGVPVCATEKEAAVKFMNLMYTNKDIMNLLVYGIEGRDYVVKDGVANFPEGVTAENVPYHSNDFLWGNSFIAYPWASTANEREESKAVMDATPVSPFLGFTCDTSKISNELTAIQNVVSEYEPGLESGTTNNYDEFIKKLKNAGIDKIITEYQTQLDAWKAAQ